MAKRTALIIAILILIGLTLAACADGSPKQAVPLIDDVSLTEERLEELASQMLGSQMANLLYASDERVVLHNTFGVIVYDLQTASIYRSIDLELLNVLTNAQGWYGLGVGVTVNKTGSEIFILGNHPDRTGFYMFEIENGVLHVLDVLDELPDMDSLRFPGLRRDLLVEEPIGWYSSQHVVTDSGAIIVLRYRPSGKPCSDVRNIQIVRLDEDGETVYTIFS